MFEWLSDNRAIFALVTIIGLVIAFVWSIKIGVEQTRLRARTRCSAIRNGQRVAGTGLFAVCPR